MQLRWTKYGEYPSCFKLYILARLVHISATTRKPVNYPDKVEESNIRWWSLNDTTEYGTTTGCSRFNVALVSSQTTHLHTLLKWETIDMQCSNAIIVMLHHPRLVGGRGFEQGSYLIPFYRGNLFIKSVLHKSVNAYRNNSPYKANAPLKKHAVGFKSPSWFPPTTNWEGGA